MMRMALKILLPLFVLAAALYVGYAIFESREVQTKRASRPPPPLVRSVTTRLTDEALVVTTHGTVSAPTESLLMSEVSGRVLWISPSLAEGGFFEQGDELVRIDPRDHELAIVLSLAEVARAELSLALEEQEAEVALEEWHAVEQVEAPALVARRPQLARARAETDAARARLSLARLDLERTVLRAPFDGRVASRSVGIGQLVTPAASLAELYGVERAEIRLPVADRELAFLELPLAFRGEGHVTSAPPVLLSSEFAGQRWSWEGRVVRTEGQIDAKTRMLHLVAEVEDPYGRSHESLRPPLVVGMFVSARLAGRSVRDVVVLPRAALRTSSQVAVIGDDMRLRFRDVTVLRIERDRVIVSAGLAGGENVCVSALVTAVDGMLVRIAADEAEQ
jgi:RND family efflux transporter MFP subunit